MIQNINIELLYNHPANPRKDLGDVSELADSIRVKGVLQNLTVVAGHMLTDSEWQALAKQFKQNPNDDTRCLMNSRKSPEGYTVVIGNRRLAAAKLAGLTELPCAIVEMDEKEQIATMLLENMQRADLTVYEQAEGFQLMMNLGLTADDITERTGFSKATVAKRVKLLELDKDSFTKACARGGTLMDFAEVSKIKDAAARKDVMSKIGTDSFKMSLLGAIKKERGQEWNDAVLPMIQAIAKPLPAEERYSSKYEHVKVYTCEGGTELELPTDSDAIKYYYDISPYSIGTITLCRAKPKAPRQEVSEEEKARRRKAKALEEPSKLAQELRMQFVRDFKPGKKGAQLSILAKAIVKHLQKSNWASLQGGSDACEYLGITEHEKGDVKELEKTILPIEQMLLACMAVSLGDDDANGYYSKYDGTHMSNERLDRLYELLVSLGYAMSDDEKQLQDGTHPLFGAEGSAK